MAMGHLPSGDDNEGGGLFVDINITPLTDIFLVLLIIFMVGASAATDANQGSIKITLPQGGTAEKAQPETPLDVFLVKVEGSKEEEPPRIILERQDLTEAQLRARLEEEFKKNPQVVVRVRADERIIHRYVTGVLDLVRDTGITRIAVATQVKKG